MASNAMNTTNTSIARQAILDSICCPITGQPMKDPVQGNDGHTYERDAITKWLTEKKALSPMTNQPMTVDNLKVNANIRYLCDQYHSGAFGTTNYKKDVIVKNTPEHKISCQAFRYQMEIDGSSKSNLHFKFNVDGVEYLTKDNTPPSDIVLVVDRSGSTDTAVEAQGEGGTKIEVGYSILDIIKHAVKTVAHSVRECDRIAVVIFDNSVETIVPLQNMTEINRASLCARIETIRPGGTTNLYGGIIEANKILQQRDVKTHNTAILALTDGQPNVRPSRGEVHSLGKMFNQNLLEAPIHTFGFGYNLERGLLYDIAKVTNATTGHIPDGGMIGTVFSNYLAMILTTACTNIKLHIKSNTPDTFITKPFVGDLPYHLSDDNSELTIEVGSLQIQQSRDVCVFTNNEETIEYYYTYDNVGKTHHINDRILIKDYEFQLPLNEHQHLVNVDEYQYQYLRLQISEWLRKAINVAVTRDSKRIVYINIINQLESWPMGLHTEKNIEKVKALLDTIKDQVYLAIGSQEKEHTNYYNKWGEFYLDQLSTALLKQYTPNFKDKACMVFGGECSKQFMEYAADTFDNLPPPKPTKQVYDHHTRSYRGGTGVASMATYNNASGGCWTGDSMILMFDGSSKRADEIKKGDSIITHTSSINVVDGPGTTVTNVLCVVETKIPNGKIKLCTIPSSHPSGGLKITEWHPIKTNASNWSFPNKIAPSEVEECTSIFNLILPNGHIPVINNIPVISLGHGYDNSILKHPYFGTRKVIDDLSKVKGFSNGHVIIYPNWFKREGPPLDNSGINTISQIIDPESKPEYNDIVEILYSAK